jgi:hypothetical protein
VPAAGVVEAVDVGFDVSYSLASGFVNRAPDQLGFDGSEHRFDHGVVIAITFARHGNEKSRVFSRGLDICPNNIGYPYRSGE